MDGYLKIKTKIDNKGVDKDITELENKIKNMQTDNTNLSQEERSLQQEINSYEELVQKADAYRNKLKELEMQRKSLLSGGLKSSQVGEYTSVTAEIDKIKSKQAEVTAEIDKQAPKIDKVYAKLNKVKAKQTENNAKISQFKDKIDQINIKKVEGSLNNIGKSIQNQIGKLGKMALAVVGIRTAWGAVRGIINSVAQYNPQIATDLAYMKYVIANSLLPVVQKLVGLAYTLLGYINAITSAWFGLNLFSNSSVKAFQKMQSGATGTAKALKEASKYTQSFDEMNIVQDNSNNSAGGAGVSVPSTDLSKTQTEIPKWLKWIIDNGEIVRKILEGIATAIFAIKYNLDLLQGVGIFLIIDGVVSLIKDLKTYLEDPTWQNFYKILKDIAKIVFGLSLLIGITTPLGLILAVIAQAVSIIGGIIQQIKTIINFINDPSWENFSQVIRGAISCTGLLGDAILWVIDNVFGGWDNVTKLLQTVGTWIYDHVIKPVGDTFQGLWDNIKRIFAPVIGFFKNIWDTVLNNIKIIINNIKQIFTVLWNKIKEIFTPVGQFFSSIFKKAYESIKKVFTPIGQFFSGIWNKIKSVFTNIGQKIGQAVSSAFKSAVNAVLSTIERILNTPIRAINGLIGVINLVPGINLSKLNTFSLPRLAKGGVISQPTQAIIGEAGKEAVVPLENNMEWLDMLADKLASKIGSNNGTYIIQMDSRVIQRGLAKKQQQLAFETNGG